MVVTMKIAFWDVMQYNTADLYQCFVGTCCPCLLAVLKMEAAGFLRD
jgi:hypothetical protein